MHVVSSQVLSRWIPFETRFESRIDRSGDCHVWTGGCTTAGYGAIKYQGQRWQTHRLAWHLANGPIPDGLWVLHHCDNPPCLRIEHLFLGTNADNAKDRNLKGRSAQQRVTHCPKGHEYTPENTYRSREGRGRHCRTCQRARRRYRGKRRFLTPRALAELAALLSEEIAALEAK